MKNVFKPGGPWKAGEISYTVESVNDVQPYLESGWYLSLEELPIEGECEHVDEEAERKSELREKIKALGGNVGGRASVETLESKLAELEAE